MYNLGTKIKKSQINNLNIDSINSIEIIENNKNATSTMLATCSDTDITLFNVSDQTKHSLYSTQGSSKSKSNLDEISCLKSYHQNDLLFASNSRHIMMFDLKEQKLVNKLKFNQETVNCMEFGSGVLTLGDDSGEIKIVDVREPTNKSSSMPSLTLRNTLKGHKNICYCLKYHPTRPYELFSGSFDCSIIKWDTRNPKNKLAG